uniref:C-type lectin domain-containing protein n=1 Tax=Neolamprologus brichardi TaxID=32507 RepID=A0A3Q4HI40_NEOBR
MLLVNISSLSPTLLVSLPGDAGRYILVQDSRSFHGARSYCRERYTDLSTVNSMHDSYSVNGNKWPIPSLSRAWIGLSNSWEWSDGSDVQLLPLTLQSGDGDCVMRSIQNWCLVSVDRRPVTPNHQREFNTST